MSADLYYLHPIVADVVSGPWQGRPCILVGWMGNTGVLVQFAGSLRLHEMRRADLHLRERPTWVRPPPSPPPPEWVDHDTGPDWPGAA